MSTATTETYIDLPTPEPGESFERYAIRAHRALAKLVTDPEDRNVLIEELYRDQAGATEVEKMAADKLPADRFIKKPNVCLFIEHETTGGDGKPKNYDLAQMVRILRNANHRIADRAAFPAISDGHTPPPHKPELPKPPILGYVGGYRLGQIGRLDPKWAIFGDEYHDRQHLDRMKQLPRRSVELWTFKDTGKSHFDPIAALGSEAPRLALPVAFHAFDHDGAEVEKYSFEAGASPAPASSAPVNPGGGNTYVKGFKGGGRKPRRAKYQQAKPMGARGMTLADQDLAQIVGAIHETPEFNWIRKKMQEEMADEQAEAIGDQPDEDLESEQPEPDLFEEDEEIGEVAEDLPVDEEAVEEDDELADIGDLLAEGDEEETAPPPEEEEEQERMSATNEQAAVVERYNALSQSHAKLIHSHGRLRKQMSGLLQERSDANRRETLRELDGRYPGFLDLNEEFQTTLYSAGASMSDEEFKAHCATIERYAARMNPGGAMVPEGVVGSVEQTAEVEKYEAALSERAVEICTAAASKGNVMSWDEGLEQAKKELNV